MNAIRSDVGKAALQTFFRKFCRSLPNRLPSRGILSERRNTPLPWVWKEVNSLGAIFFPADNHTAPV